MKLIFRNHALKRMFERNIEIEDVKQIIETGKIIHDYPEDQPYPSYLLLGWKNNMPLHVVCADNELNETIIITAYNPDPFVWNKDFTRKTL
jgi:hypothetical protein